MLFRSLMRRAHENNADTTLFSDGELTDHRVDAALRTFGTKTTPSCLPNVELVRNCVTELYENQSDILRHIEQAYVSSDDLDSDAWIANMADSLNLFAPTLSAVIDVSMKSPEIFIAKNDVHCTNIGCFAEKPVILTPDDPISEVDDQLSTEEEVESSEPMEVYAPAAKPVHTGIMFKPPSVKVTSSKRSAYNQGEPRIIRNYSFKYHGYGTVKTATRVNDFLEVPTAQHKHPVKYALQFFCSTVISSLSTKVLSSHHLIVGTFAEALSVFYWNKVAIPCLEDPADHIKPDDREHQKWLAAAGHFDMQTHFGLKPLMFFTSDTRYLDTFKRINKYDDCVIYHPACDYIKLLRDSANAALLYKFPKFEGGGKAIQIKLWDRRHQVATYTFKVTPLEGTYHLYSFANCYRLHPIFRTKDMLLGNELPAIHFLKVAICGLNKTTVVPIKTVPDDREVSPDVRPLPALCPIDPNMKYDEYFGRPYLLSVSLKSPDIVVRAIDLITREQHIHRKHGTLLAGVLDAVWLAFKLDGYYRVVRVLYSSITEVVDAGLPEHVIDIMSVLGYMTNMGPSRVLCGHGFKRDGWYVPVETVFGMRIGGSYMGGFSHGFPENISMLLPLCTTKVITKVSAYAAPSKAKDAMDFLLGVRDISVAIDGEGVA